MGDDVDDVYDNWGMMMMWEMMEMMGWSDGGSNKMFMKLFKLVTINDTLQIFSFALQVHHREQQREGENKDDRARSRAHGEGLEEEANVLLHPKDTPEESSKTTGQCCLY